MYVLKLGRSGEDGDKVLLLIESGSRLHTIDAMPDKSDVPSNFSLKLRKHVRTRRLEDIRQLGVDRVVQLTFGSGEATFHLILEFYAQGNVILTDKKYEVLSLLRSHRDDAKGMATMARHIYPIHSVRLRQPVPADALRASLTAPPSYGNSGAESSNDGQKESTAAGEGAGPQDKSKGGGEESPLVLKVALAQAMPYGPLAAEHCALLAKLDPQRCLETAPLTADEQTALLGAVRSFEKWLDSCEEEAPGGCIILSQKQPKGGKAVSSAKAGVKAAHDASEASYEEFQPLLAGGRPFEQYLGRPMLTFPTFDAAVSEFFGKLQGQRLAAQQVQREKATMGKLEAIRSDHVARLATLSNEAKDAEHKAALIEFNLDAVDAALNAVREALASGMDWRDLGRMIKEEKKAGNPVAALIDSLQLEKNRVTLLLRNPFEEEESEDESENEDSDSDTASEEEIQPPKGANKAGKKGDQNGAGRKGPHHSMVYRVDVDLDLSANANACVYYDARRKHSDKARRTLEANERALAAAEKRALDQLERVRMSAKGAAAAAAAARKPYWFERFHWFISSENYLVLSGRDAQQNELLVKRFMRCVIPSQSCHEPT